MNVKSQNIFNILIFTLGLFCCIYFFALNIVGTSYDFFPGDLGDARFNNYLLEHSYQFLCGNLESLWNAPFLYPEEKIITYSDNLVGSSPFYALFRLIGQDRETSFQSWFVLMTAINYSCCYILLNYIFKNSYAAVLGAIVFTCSIALQSQVGHAQTIPRFPIPLGILFGLKYIENLNPKYFFLMILMLVYQMYCGIYLGFLMSVPIMIIIFTSIFLKLKLYLTKIKDPKWIGLILLSCFLSCLLLTILLFPYKERSDLGGLYSYKDIAASVPTFKSYFYSNSGSLFWKSLEHIAEDYTFHWDFKIFPGGIATISILFFMLFNLKTIIQKKEFKEENTAYFILFVVSIFTFLFFIRINDLSLYRILFNLPGFASMRALQRIINVELVFYAIATAYFCKYFLINKNNTRNFIAFTCLLSIVILDNKVVAEGTHRTKKSISQERVSVLINKMKWVPIGSVISYEPDTMYSHPNDYQIDAMLATQSLSLKCLNGYTATSPNEYYLYWGKPNELSRKRWLNYKKASSQKIIIIH